jgi:hypothetical protein
MERVAAMFVMYKILTSGDVNTIEAVFPTYYEKSRDDAIVALFFDGFGSISRHSGFFPGSLQS